jgi:hypothetical protein
MSMIIILTVGWKNYWGGKRNEQGLEIAYQHQRSF